MCRILPRSGDTEQPRVLTLGYSQREIRPESGGRRRLLRLFACCPSSAANVGRHFSSFVPFSQNYGGQSGHFLLTALPRVKTLGCFV